MTFWIIQNTLVTGLLAAAVWLVCRFRHSSPAVRHALWLVVLVKFLLPPLVFWPWALPVGMESIEDSVVADATGMTNTSEALPDPQPQQVGDDLIVSSETFEVTVSNDSDEAGVRLVLPESADRRPEPKETSVSATGGWLKFVTRDRLVRIALMIWAIGGIGLFLVQLLRIRQVVRQLQRAGPAPQWLIEAVREFSATLGIRAPRVTTIPMITSPVLWALGRPTILWPEKLAENEHASWRGVVVHELAHLRRRDHWVGWLEMVAGCLWWWNPLFWMVRHQVRENAELACDAWVVEVLPDGRRSYAEALLAVCEFVSQPVPMPAVGMATGARRSFERRLTMILSERVPKTISRTSLLVVLLLGVLALPGWSQTGQNENVIPTAQTQNNDTTNRGDDNRGQDDVAAEQEPQKNNAQLDRATILRPGRAQVENPLIHAPNTIDTGSRISDKATRGHSAETNGEIPMLNARANSSKARDARLRQLEKQMQTLISELRSLRLKRSSTAAGELREAAGVEAVGVEAVGVEAVGVEAVGVEAAGVNTAAGLAENPNLNFRRPRVSHTRFDGYGTSAIASSPFSDIARKPPSHVVNSRTITLTRTTYRLDRKKGEARFLLRMFSPSPFQATL